jgi:hypothetical protein
MANTKTNKKKPKKNTTKSANKPKVEKKVTKVEKEPIVKEEIKEVEVKEEKKCPKKKYIIIGSIIAGVILLAVLIILCITFFFNKERIVTKKVKSMGVDYYTNYLYDTLAKGRDKKDLDKILIKYASIGIKMDLNTLEKYDSGKYKDEIKNLKSKKKACDKNNTKVTIYPEEPYNKTDYRVEIELDCGF